MGLLDWIDRLLDSHRCPGCGGRRAAVAAFDRSWVQLLACRTLEGGGPAQGCTWQLVAHHLRYGECVLELSRPVGDRLRTMPVEMVDALVPLLELFHADPAGPLSRFEAAVLSEPP